MCATSYSRPLISAPRHESSGMRGALKSMEDSVYRIVQDAPRAGYIHPLSVICASEARGR